MSRGLLLSNSFLHLLVLETIPAAIGDVRMTKTRSGRNGRTQDGEEKAPDVEDLNRQEGGFGEDPGCSGCEHRT